MQENIPEIGMEQDVKTDPGDTEKYFVSKRFESYDGSDRLLKST